MAVQFENYSHSFRRNDKPIFSPSERGRRIGRDLKERIEAIVSFEEFFFHLRPGGHVAALHAHRANAWFCKVDIRNFYYSISRNRVVSALRSIGIPRPAHYGKWSCVRNPYEEPRYAVPYGFVQSPIVASLVLSTSALGAYLREVAAQGVTVAVYVDDISFSSNNCELLGVVHAGALSALSEAGFTPSEAKTVVPNQALSIFNCDLRSGFTTVLPERVARFYDLAPSFASIDGFERYCLTVSTGNE